MPSIPNHMEALESFGLLFSGMAIEFTEKEIGESTSHQKDDAEFEFLKNYFLSRGVIATMAWGPDFGSNAKYVVNFAWWDSGEDAETTPIASANTEGVLVRGQEAEWFVQGLAHSLQRSIVVDDEVRYFPTNVEPEIVDPELEKADLTQGLGLVPGRRPFGAYTTLLAGELPGQYGLTESDQLILPAQGYHALPIIGTDSEQQFPTYQFLKRGKVRQFELRCDYNESSWALVTCAPNYEPATTYLEGSDAHKIAGILSEPVRIDYSDDWPKAGKKGPFGGRNIEATQHAASYFGALTTHFDPLTRVNPDIFFARVCALLALPESTTKAVLEFEQLRPGTTIDQIGDVALTTVIPPTDQTTREKVGLLTAMEHLISSFPTNSSASSRAKDRISLLGRSRQNKSLLILAVVVMFAVALGVSALAIFNVLDLTVIERVLTIPVIGFCGFIGWSLLLASTKFDEARERLRSAQRDGVLPWKI